MNDKTAVVFTAKSIDRLIEEGGTSSWKVDRNNARSCAYAVCTRNAHASWVEGTEPHRSAFLIGKVNDVVPAPDHDKRYLFSLSEFARLDMPDVWKGDRNPVKYSSLKALGIDPSKLKWEPMPTKKNKPASKDEGNADNLHKPLTISEAKKALAQTFGVSPEAIEITIRG